jgi:glycosyltransferase involved in cell wall biosynthesis
MLSIVIPSRSDQWLQKTVDDLFNKAEGEVEVIVVYDGRWADPILKDDPRLVQIHHGELHNNLGMRPSINAGVAVSRGKYLMVIDEQCGVDQGYDVKLAADCEDDWVVIPRRWRLEPNSWKLTTEVEGDKREPIDYMAVEYPYLKPLDKTQGLHGKLWNRPERADILIDDTPTSQGSCYFMTRKHWDNVIGELDSTYYGPFTMEAQEVGLKTWLSGGRQVVNKRTWYSHWHKGRAGKSYGFTTEQYRRHQEGMEKGRLYAIQYWLNTKDFKYDWDWFVTEKFPDMPGWSPDWKARVERDKVTDYSSLKYEGDEWLKNLRTE